MFFAHMQELVVSKNFFNGPLPVEIGLLYAAKRIAATDNLFEGKSYIVLCWRVAILFIQCVHL